VYFYFRPPDTSLVSELVPVWYLLFTCMVAGPCLCGRTFANAGNLANHRKRCLASQDDVQAPPAPTVQFPESVVADYMDDEKQYQVGICQVSVVPLDPAASLHGLVDAA
jgi:hypothetical protein